MLQQSTTDREVALGALAQSRPALGGMLDSRILNICLALLIVALWLATRPYFGLVLDSRLYMLHAFNAMSPARFVNDLYLQFGSQDRFTVYTPLIQPVLARLGVARTMLFLTIIGQALWLSGLTYLARGLFADRGTRVLAIAFAVALPNDVIFRYGEWYPTPRIFAEGLTLWALGTMLRGRSIRALLTLSVALVIHPLMTLAGLAVLILYKARARRIWLVAGSVALLAAASLGLAGIQPFARAFALFDPAWFAVVKVRDDIALITQWSYLYVLKACNLLLLAAVVFTVAGPRERNLLMITLFVGLAGLGLTLLGGDFLHDVLAVDAQQYRAIWLLHLTTNMLVAIVVRFATGAGASPFAQMVLACTLLLQLLANFFPTAYFGATAMLPVAWVVIRASSNNSNAIAVVARIVGLAVMALAVAVTAVLVYYGMRDAREIPALMLQRIGGLAITLGALATICWLVTPNPWRGGPKALAATFALATVLIVAAVARWDERTPWDKFIETADAPQDLEPLLSPAKPVYWEGDVRLPWFVLKRASYFSCTQGAGLLFFRGTALAYDHRYKSFEPLRTMDFGEETACPPPPPSLDLTPTRATLVAVCAREPELGSIVLIHPIKDVEAKVWAPPVPFESNQLVRGIGPRIITDRFFVYSCDDLR